MDVKADNIAAIDAIKRRCRLARIKPKDLCARAEIAYSTFWRAAKGDATVTTLGKLEDALVAVEREKAPA